MEPQRVRGLGDRRRRPTRLSRALRRHRRGGSGARDLDPDGNLHMQMRIPDFALVALIGASGSGKSSFAAKHFAPTEVISSDRMRGWVADSEMDQSATPDAFDVLF